jgi:cytochrome bd-type quinol oxidase subunit 1
MWRTSNVFLAFLFIAFIIGLILALVIITQKDHKLKDECYKANRIRAGFLLAISFVIGLIVLIYQHKEHHHEGFHW